MDPEKQEREMVDRFESEVLPGIVRGGHLPTGRNPRIERCNLESTERFTDHFASSPYFLNLVVDSDDGKSELDLLVKFCSQDSSAMKQMHLDLRFYNEIQMYARVLNEFRDLLRKNPNAPQDLIDEIAPKCYYAHFDKEDPKKSILVFANLKKLRYTTAESKNYLDFEHCATAMRQIGKFHALSLSMKIRYPELLEKLKTIFVESAVLDDSVSRENCNVFHHICNQRAIDYLLSLDRPAIPKEYVVNFRNLISRPYELVLDLLKPKEPLALICHGDFCRNNMLFLYDKDRIVDLKLFDYQTSRYASPSIDLSFFMYLNTTQELREKHFDELFGIYYSTLIATTSAIIDLPEKEISDKYPLEMFRDDFARHAVYAYFHVAFFQSVMAEKYEVNWDDPPEERARQLYHLGGKEVSKSISNVLLDFYKRKFYSSA